MPRTRNNQSAGRQTNNNGAGNDAMMHRLVENALTTRQTILRQLFDPRRDIDFECGYPETLTITDYRKLYKRSDVAGRVVNIFPEETWKDRPNVFETEDSRQTEFERGWGDLVARLHVYTYLQRADILSGIGRFGILLLGLDDGKDLRDPVEGVDERGFPTANRPQQNLIFLRPFDESLVTVKSLVNDLTNPRYGLPLEYEIHFAEASHGMPLDDQGKQSTTSRIVHWSRVIHLADNRGSSEVFGHPRMELVANRLLDLRKIGGGSAEMFWKGGFPGYSLETSPKADEQIEFDKKATREEMENYMNGLQRYIATIGMQVKSLSVQIAEPTAHVETQLKLIAIAYGIPWRVLVGSEAAQLASEQDTIAWNRRINRRRTDYVTPFVLSPFIQRCIDLGVVPEPGEEGFHVFWPDLNSPTDKDKAEVGARRSEALAKYVQSGADVIIPPFHYLTLVLGMTEDEANSIIDAAEQRMNDVDDDEEEGDDEEE